MSKSGLNLFEQLKIGSPVSKGSTEIIPPFFKLTFIENDCLLSVVSKDNKPIDLDYSQYAGATRRLIKTLEQMHNRLDFSIDLANDEQRVNLSENEFLIWQLNETGSIVDESMESIAFCQTTGHLQLHIEENSQLSCRLALNTASNVFSDFQLISESFCFAENTIYPIEPIGENHPLVLSFETLILPSELENYLTLLFSYFEQIEIVYLDYQVVNGEEIVATPSLMIDKIAPDGSLYLKTAFTIATVDPEFLNQYDISRIARLDKSSKEIVIHSLRFADMTVYHSAVEKTLSDRKKTENDSDAEIYREDNLFIISPALAEAFLLKDLPALASIFSIFGSEKLDSFKIKVVKPEIKLSLDHGIDFLEGSVDLVIENEVFSLFDALYLYRQNSYIPLNDGSRALIDQEYLDRLERLFQKSRDKVKVSFFDLPLVDELIGDVISEDSLSPHRSVFEGFGRLDELAVTIPKLDLTCRPYQIDGYKWLKYLQTHHLGGCLADDMGLGKTVQTIALMSSIYPDETRPSLIVIPKSLIFNWREEIARFNPSLSVAVYYGPDRDLKTAGRSNIIITTYGMVRNDIERFKDERFCYVILDESQNIKNVHSQVSRAVTILKSDHRLALSGTPVENNLSELYALFRFLNPGMFGGLDAFNRQYLFPIQQKRDENVMRELKRKIYPFILRRQKKDVLKELPDKVEQILMVEMTPEHKKLYEQRRQFFYETAKDQILNEGIDNSRFFVLQALTDLRQAASIPEVKSDGLIISPKRELLIQMMAEAIANGHKILLFANFLSILDAVAEDLSTENIGYEIMTGASRNREEIVKRFQDDKDQKVFLMTLKTGGVGLNLTAADRVFIFDPWWNLASENQAVDRSHRIGQLRTVFSYKLVTKGTIEEKILKLQRQKKQLADEIISDDTSAVKLLNEEDIDYILGDRE